MANLIDKMKPAIWRQSVILFAGLCLIAIPSSSIDGNSKRQQLHQSYHQSVAHQRPTQFLDTSSKQNNLLQDDHQQHQANNIELKPQESFAANLFEKGPKQAAIGNEQAQITTTGTVFNANYNDNPFLQANSQPITVDVSSSDTQNYDWLFKLQQQEQELNPMQTNSNSSSTANYKPPAETQTEKITPTTIEQSSNILPFAVSSQDNTIQQNIQDRPIELNRSKNHLYTNELNNLSLATLNRAQGDSGTELPPTQTPDFFFSATERFPSQERAPNAWW